MHISFLEFLVDPLSKEPLALDIETREGDFIIEGKLKSSSRAYPIVRGIPRFAGYNERINYTKSFSYQWGKWSRVQFESENANGPMRGHTLRMWEKIVGAEMGDLQNGIVADFGCGPGRFIQFVRMKKGRAIGIDLSDAVETAAQNFAGDPSVLICQADALASPIRPGSIDGAFSIGVLHHTPDPKRGFGEIAKTVHSGGWAAVSVYGKGVYYDFPTVQAYRKAFQLLWPFFRHYPPLIYAFLAAYVMKPLSYVPLLGLIVRAVFPFVRLPDARWSFLDTFDSVTPHFQSAHESFEVYQWFKEYGLIDIAPSDWGFTSYHGVRK